MHCRNSFRVTVRSWISCWHSNWYSDTFLVSAKQMTYFHLLGVEKTEVNGVYELNTGPVWKKFGEIKKVGRIG